MKNKRLIAISISFIFIAFIISACGVSADAAETYYVDATGGNNSNDGLSEATAWKTISKVKGTSFSPGDQILFKRGERWRERLIPHSGDATGYITYGAYGEGNKPLLLGSVTRNNESDWTDEGGNIWRTSGLSLDVGNMIFDNEDSVGEKVRSESELDTQGNFLYDEVNLALKIYSQANPAIYYSNIELALKRDIISQGGKSYVIYENLDLRYGGAHGIGGGNVHHIIVRNCDLSYIGGGKHYGDVRYGNGIEFWNGAHDTLVEGCRISEIYDAALTTQGNSTNAMYNQYYRHNVIWNSEYCFEYTNSPQTSITNNIYFEYNTCVNSGRGWGHFQRWFETDGGWSNGVDLMFFKNYASTDNFYVQHNIFYGARWANFWLYEIWNGVENLVLDYNLWYQPSGSTLVGYLCTSLTCVETYMMTEFAQYQIDTGMDANSLATNPFFLNLADNDFRPVTGSPACIMSETGSYVGALPCTDITDSDGDGMSDSFENFYGLNPDDSSDAGLDNDGDGLTNYSEYVLGTDPTNPDTDGDGRGDASDTCPSTTPVIISGTEYSSLQAAYAAALEDETIKMQETIFTGDHVFSFNKSVKIESGYDCNYLTHNLTTIISGNATISDGKVTVENGTLKLQ